jgi:hypothetical protein
MVSLGFPFVPSIPLIVGLPNILSWGGHIIRLPQCSMRFVFPTACWKLTAYKDWDIPPNQLGRNIKQFSFNRRYIGLQLGRDLETNPPDCFPGMLFSGGAISGVEVTLHPKPGADDIMKEISFPMDPNKEPRGALMLFPYKREPETGSRIPSRE